MNQKEIRILGKAFKAMRKAGLMAELDEIFDIMADEENAKKTDKDENGETGEN